MENEPRCNYCGMPLGEQDCNEAFRIKSTWNPRTKLEERRLVSAGLMHVTPCIRLFARQKDAGCWAELPTGFLFGTFTPGGPPVVS